jgi:hypothetical protein
MKKSRFSEEQMVKILREADKSPVARVAKKHGVSEQTIYAWRKRFGTPEAVEDRGPRLACFASPRSCVSATMKTLFGNTLIVIGVGWLLLGSASDAHSSPGDAPSAISVAGFECAFSETSAARWPEESQSEEFRGALERGDLEGFCHSFGILMDALYGEPWRLAEVNPIAPHRGCAVVSPPPGTPFMCCPCKYPGALHEICME